MDNQHRKIEGYRDLDQSVLDKINSVKAMEREAAELVKKLRADPEVDQRAVSVAVTHFQTACMWLTKGIGKSTDPFA